MNGGIEPRRNRQADVGASHLLDISQVGTPSRFGIGIKVGAARRPCQKTEIRPPDVGAQFPALHSGRAGLVLPSIYMPEETTAKKSNGGGLDLEAQHWAAADVFQPDLHPQLKADFVPVWKDLANPPFNVRDLREAVNRIFSAQCL